jgi:hypothetical protein
MNRLEILPQDIQQKIYGYRLQQALESKYYNKIKCSPNRDINSLTKQDLIDCIINRYFFVSIHYKNLLGRARYKYVIDGLSFLNMLFNLLEHVDSHKKNVVEQSLELNKLVKIINKCAKTFSVDLKQYPKELKEMKILESYDYLLENMTDDFQDYKKLGKKDVNDILNMFNKDLLKALYTKINTMFPEREIEWED